MPSAAYLYELRRGDEIVATGHLVYDTALEVGSRVSIGGLSGIVRAIVPIRGHNELRLVVQLLP